MVSASLAKLGASVGLAVGLAFVPLMEKLQADRPLVLYAMVYFQAVLGNTDSALRIAQQAARSETGDSAGPHLARHCPAPASF
jgi:hypothetical protein